MKKLCRFLFCVCLGGASSAWAGLVDVPTTNPGDFGYWVDWCSIAGPNCAAVSNPTPTAWTDTSSNDTGQVGMFYDPGTPSFLVGADPSGMGVITNSHYIVGTTTYWDDVAATFDQPMAGAGAFIESVAAGTDYASVFLFNNVYNIFIGYTWSVTFTAPNQKLFIGINNSSQDIAGAIFDLSDTTSFNTLPFQVGEVGFNAPEPGSLILAGSTLLGLAALLRKRLRRS